MFLVDLQSIRIKQEPVQAWIHELRLVIGTQGLVVIVEGRKVFWQFFVCGHHDVMHFDVVLLPRAYTANRWRPSIGYLCSRILSTHALHLSERPGATTECMPPVLHERWKQPPHVFHGKLVCSSPMQALRLEGTSMVLRSYRQILVQECQNRPRQQAY